MLIASVRGKLLQNGLDWVVVDMSGFGMKLFVPPSNVGTLGKPGTEVSLSTYLVVREDALTLYGFATALERDTFEILLGVSGIGPRTALAALSVLTPAELSEAVEASDLTTLQRVPGVGKKSAQRMVLELGGKLTVTDDTESSTVPGSALRAEVGAALEQLGWSKAVSERTLAKLDGEYADASELLRAALLELGTGRGR